MTKAKYRHALPQLKGQMFLTDGGLETTLIFHNNIDLPHFAAFDLLRTRQGRDTLKAYYSRYAEIALARDQGFVLDSPTWRASKDWGDLLGYSAEALEAANREAVEMLFEVRDACETEQSPFVVSGNIGPRGDGYSADVMMTCEEAQTYHSDQVTTLASTGVDMITVLTMTHAEEAVGIARAAKTAGVPVVISFTVETDGRLPTGQSLGAAIAQVDAMTGGAPVYYMINCAHPSHFEEAVVRGESWTARIRGLRANASTMSHGELDRAEVLDDGDPASLGAEYRDLMRRLPNLVVLGGCCGTDHRHITSISHCCSPARQAA